MKNHRFINVHIIIFGISLALIACHSQDNNTANQNDPKSVKNVEIPEFNGDSAYLYVQKQVNFGPRVPGSDAWSQCALWFEKMLKPLCDTLYIQDFKARAFNNEILKGKNFIAVFRPEAKKRIMLSSHWDSRPFADHDKDSKNHRKPVDGANDGASGVGVLIEMARIFKLSNPEIGVDIVLFDIEDYGPPQDAQKSEDSEDFWGLGSQYWSKNPHIPNYRAYYGVLLDMVGVPEPRFLQEGFSVYYAPHVVKKVWNLAASMGYAQYFPQEQGGYITDDHYYVNKLTGIPTINIIHLEKGNNSFFKHWHTVHDNMESVDVKSLQMVGSVITQLIYSE